MNKEDQSKSREFQQVVLLEHFLERGGPETFLHNKQTAWPAITKSEDVAVFPHLKVVTTKYPRKNTRPQSLTKLF